jgi:outer membrane scaffolding protein for murein synthesis (MipA/OmpV family)
MKMLWCAAGAVLGIVGLSTSALAVDWTVGIGAAAAPDYEGSNGYEAVPLWNLRAGDLYHPKTYIQVLGPRLTSNFLPSDNWRLGLSGQFVAKRDDVEDDKVDKLKSTDSGFLLGPLIGYDFMLSAKRVLGLELDSRYDVGDELGGLVTARIKYRAPFGDSSWVFDGRIESTYASGDYMNEFFSINAADSARSGIKMFNADSGIKDVGARASVGYKFENGIGITAMASVTQLLGDASDSPVTDDQGSATQLFGGALVSYSF